ncbi:MAG: gliding motility-associated C-terminal domain-containing protein [Bacteroidetes bacterium]|nr:gliding motility-associated C-terminal domain-containing protein [Bacteroidota bacterium]
MLLFATGNGLVKYDGTDWITYKATDLNSPYYGTIAMDFDNDGNLWIITYYGLAKFDGVHWSTWDLTHLGTYANQVQGMDIDSDDNIWLTSRVGLVKFDGDSIWQVYDSTDSGLPLSGGRNVYIDQSDNVWVSCLSNHFGGLVKFDGINWTLYDTYNSGISENNIGDVVVDKNNCAWIATMGGFLSVYCCVQPTFSLPEDAVICDDIPITLDAGNSSNSYLWVTGDTTQSIIVYEKGSYWVKIGLEDCTIKKSIEVYKDTCDRQVTVEENNIINFSKMSVPNAFTPNGDGLNDYFNINTQDLSHAHMLIFNRSGLKIFETFDLSRGWDGSYQGQPLSTGTYMYIIEYEYLDHENEQILGTVTLLR